MKDLEPLAVNTAPTKEDMQLRRTLSQEYRETLHKIFLSSSSPLDQDHQDATLLPLTVTVLALVGDKRRVIWTKEIMPLVCEATSE